MVQTGEVSTVFVGGFPPDVVPRELDNLCRWMPGFVTSNVSTTKGTTLFVLFDHPSSAHAAIQLLNNQQFDRSVPGEPMRATMARSNMRSNNAQTPSPQVAPHRLPPSPQLPPVQQFRDAQPPPPTAPHPMLGAIGANDVGHGGKRPRIPEDPNQVDTVASVGALDVGYDETSLRAFFESLPGFVDFKGNPRMGGGFAKYVSADLAKDAMVEASNQGIPCEMAKSSMGTPSGNGNNSTPAITQFSTPPPAMSNPACTWGSQAAGFASMPPPVKRPRIPENPQNVDTVASVGASENGYDEDNLNLLFSSMPGFVAFKGNPRMGGGFAKFGSAELARQAVQIAQEQGVPCEMAKSSMSGP